MVLNIEPTKTALVAFTRKRKSSFKTIIIDAQNIHWKKVKYLSVNLNNKLSWNKLEFEVPNKA